MRQARRATGGYTVVETLMFLAISSGLFVMAAVFITSIHRRTEFGQTVREVESVLRDVVNDINTGYYPSNNNFQCFATAGIVQVNSGSPNAQGTNQDCIFLGKVLHFPVNDNDRQIKSYTVVGRRLANGTNNQATSYPEADPTADDDLPNDEYEFSRAISFVSVRNSGTPIGAFGIYSSLSPSVGGSSSGSLSANLLPIPGTNNNTNKNQLFSQINGMNSASDFSGINPQDGVVLCLRSNGTNQYARITVGGRNRRLAVETVITNTACT